MSLSAPAQTFAMVPIDEYERLKANAQETEHWRGQANQSRRDKNEAERVAIILLNAAGGTLKVATYDLWSIEHDPEMWEVLWASYDGVVDPLGNNLTYAIKRRAPDRTSAGQDVKE